MSEIGADKYYDSTDNIFRGSLVYDKFKPIQYSNSDQIFTPVWERSGHPTSLLHSVKVQQFQEGSNQIVAFDTIRVEVYFSKQLESITRYPESIVMGLVKIGGLLALFKIFLVLQCLNKYRFERDVMNQDPNGHRDDES